MNVDGILSDQMIIPVIALGSHEDAPALADALASGGLSVAEVTFRTAAAATAIRAIRDRFPDFLVGAGTVTTQVDLHAAIDAGAQFGVAPGFNPQIVTAAKSAGLPFFPGVCTPTEIEAALSIGINVLKFFPAEAVGGLKALKAMAAPYSHRKVRFIPTGGIDANRMRDYLKEPTVLAIGGSWMVAARLLKEKDWKQVTTLTGEAVKVAREARGAACGPG